MASRRAWFVAAWWLCASCATWRTTDPQALAMREETSRPRRVFVVTASEAFDLYLRSSDATTLRGRVIDAWDVIDANGVVYRDEPPAEIVRRLGWVPQHRIPDEVLVKIGSIRYARTRTWTRNTMSIGFVVVAGIAVGMLSGFALATSLD